MTSCEEFLKGLRESLEGIRAQLDEIDAIREKCIELSRMLIRQSSIAIKHAHRRERELAETALREAAEIVKELNEIASSHEGVLSWGFIQDAQREFSEASIFFAIAFGGKLPTPEDLKVNGVAYINGLAEAMGEVRRLILDKMDEGDWETIKSLLKLMEDTYFELLLFDHSDAITLGLRRRLDQVRAIFEKTHGEVALALRCSILAKLLGGQAEENTVTIE